MDRFVDIATDGRHLSVHRGFLVVTASSDASGGREEVGRVPLDDVAAVIVHAHGVTWTTNLVCALAERGASVVFCGPNHAPVALCLPLEAHHTQNARMRAQWAAGRPLQKQLWREIVVAKIRWQGAMLAAHGHEAGPFDFLARKVRSGDPDNVEAQAARRYWPLMMGPDFRRDRNSEGANALLNYGYTVLRSVCARAVVAAGLHPSIGVHHANRANAFALADDLIEPLRPLVDAVALRLLKRGTKEVGPEAKRAFAGLIALDLPGEAGTTTVANAALRTAQSLALSFQSGRVTDFVLARPPSAIELAGLDAAEP